MTDKQLEKYFQEIADAVNDNTQRVMLLENNLMVHSRAINACLKKLGLKLMGKQEFHDFDQLKGFIDDNIENGN